MPVGWFIAPYDLWPGGRKGKPARENAVSFRYGDLIYADGGDWRDRDLPRGFSLVKVRASATTLQTVAGDADITRIPKALLDDPLSDLTPQQRNAIQSKLNQLGYTNAEITAALGNDLRTKTLGDILRFACRRAARFRVDPNNAINVLYDLGDADQPDPATTVSSLDTEVT